MFVGQLDKRMRQLAPPIEAHHLGLDGAAGRLV